MRRLSKIVVRHWHFNTSRDATDANRLWAYHDSRWRPIVFGEKESERYVSPRRRSDMIWHISAGPPKDAPIPTKRGRSLIDAMLESVSKS